jgi:hypothetical protein
MKINLMGVPRDKLLRCLHALREADKAVPGLHLVEKLLFSLVQREGRSVH